MKNSKRDRVKTKSEEHEVRLNGRPTPITDEMWRRASTDGSFAKEMLVNMAIGGKGRVKFVKLSNGNQIPIQEITEKQAQDFMSMLAPERGFPT